MFGLVMLICVLFFVADDDRLFDMMRQSRADMANLLPFKRQVEEVSEKLDQTKQLSTVLAAGSVRGHQLLGWVR